MSPTEVEARVARGWAVTGPILEDLRRRALREMTEDQALEAVLDLLDLATLAPAKAGGSGLVEQQRYFALARR
ncbi:MAG: hypothetical protein H0T04_03765 [Chloroflexi bacterium]|nr:hypothetical protein [Chloroflexota bacterium]MDQ3407633.1 hypothetical protein [Chloroflexota bacterium]